MNSFLDFEKSGKSIIIFGACVTGAEIYFQLVNHSCFENKVFFCDNFKTGAETYTKEPIYSFEQIKILQPDSIIILAIQSDEIREQVKKQIQQESIGFVVVDWPQIVSIIKNETGGGIEWYEREVIYDWEVNREKLEKICEWLDEFDESVIDFGAGEAYLGELLNDEIRYIPTDYVARKNDFLVYDFNKDLFPCITTDVSVLFQILYYIEDVECFIENVCKYTRHKIILALNFKNSKGLIKKTYYPSEKPALIDLIEKNGFKLEEEVNYIYGDGTVAQESVFLFLRK